MKRVVVNKPHSSSKARITSLEEGLGFSRNLKPAESILVEYLLNIKDASKYKVI